MELVGSSLMYCSLLPGCNCQMMREATPLMGRLSLLVSLLNCSNYDIVDTRNLINIFVAFYNGTIQITAWSMFLFNYHLHLFSLCHTYELFVLSVHHLHGIMSSAILHVNNQSLISFLVFRPIYAKFFDIFLTIWQNEILD